MKLEELINENYSKLSENDLLILKYIMANKKSAADLGIRELGKKCNVSSTTILRFTQKLGLSGFSEFKAFLNFQDQESDNLDIEVVDSFYMDLEETIKNLKQTKFTGVCKSIYEADRVFVFGTGSSQMTVSKELHRVFLSAHKYLHVIEGAKELQIILPNLTPKDLVIIVSLSGTADYLIDVVHDLNIRDIKFISMTAFTNNEVAIYAEHSLYICTTLVSNNLGITYRSTQLFFILVDVLFREYLKYIENPSI